MILQQYIQALYSIEQRLTENFIKTAEYYKSEPGIYYGCQEMASISNDQSRELKRENRRHQNVGETPGGFQSMVRDHETGNDFYADLHFLWLLTMEASLMTNLLINASVAMMENDLELMCTSFVHETEKQSEWLLFRLNMAARRESVNA